MSADDQNFATVDEDVDMPSTSTGVTRPRPLRGDEKLSSVKQNVARLRECEDYNMALALQEAEFSEHYRLNRTERQIVGGDFQTSVEEQRRAMEVYFTEAAKIAERDAELARILQSEMEAEEAEARQHQTRLDEEFARRLQLEEEQRMVDFTADPSPAAGLSTSRLADVTDGLRVVLPPNIGDRHAGAPSPIPDEQLEKAGSSGLGFQPTVIRADPPSYAECMTMEPAGSGDSVLLPPQRFSDSGVTNLMNFGCDDAPSTSSPRSANQRGSLSQDACQRNAAAIDALLFENDSAESTILSSSDVGLR